MGFNAVASGAGDKEGIGAMVAVVVGSKVGAEDTLGVTAVPTHD